GLRRRGFPRTGRRFVGPLGRRLVGRVGRRFVARGLIRGLGGRLAVCGLIVGGLVAGGGVRRFLCSGGLCRGRIRGRLLGGSRVVRRRRLGRRIGRSFLWLLGGGLVIEKRHQLQVRSGRQRCPTLVGRRRCLVRRVGVVGRIFRVGLRRLVVLSGLIGLRLGRRSGLLRLVGRRRFCRRGRRRLGLCFLGRRGRVGGLLRRLRGCRGVFRSGRLVCGNLHLGLVGRRQVRQRRSVRRGSTLAGTRRQVRSRGVELLVILLDLFV